MMQEMFVQFLNVEDQLADETSLLHMTRKLIALRKSSHALSAEGEIEFLNRRYNGYPMIFRRSGEDGSYLVCINPTDRAQSFAWDLEGAQVVLENAACKVTPGEICLEPVSFAILKM